MQYVPVCKDCGENMKPHCMFFDERYTEEYYTSDTVQYFAKDMDALVVVGTALQTNLAARLASDALDRDDVPVIEVNLESCLDVGYLLRVKEKSEVALPEIFKTWVQANKEAKEKK